MLIYQYFLIFCVWYNELLFINVTKYHWTFQSIGITIRNKIEQGEICLVFLFLYAFLQVQTAILPEWILPQKDENDTLIFSNFWEVIQHEKSSDYGIG